MKLPMLGIASSNIRRQLKRIKDLHLIETNANLYRVAEYGELSEIFEEKVENFVLKSVLGRVKEYVKKIDQEFSEGAEGLRKGTKEEEVKFSPELLRMARAHR